MISVSRKACAYFLPFSQSRTSRRISSLKRGDAKKRNRKMNSDQANTQAPKRKIQRCSYIITIPIFSGGKSSRESAAKHTDHYPNHKGHSDHNNEHSEDEENSIHKITKHRNNLTLEMGAGGRIELPAIPDNSIMLPLHHPAKLKVYNQKRDCR